jgi:hypothetical protein
LATGKEIPHFKIKLYHFILFSLLLFFYPFILYDSFSKKQAQPEESEQSFPPLSFASSDESWDALAGREGLALVRNGKTIYDIITCMS